MLDIGWTELVVIAIVLIVVVGPKDLPPMLRAFGKMMTKVRGMAGDFRQQFDEALKEADLDEVRKTISDAKSLNPVASIREAMSPLRQMGNELKADLQKATTTEKKAEPAPEPVVPAATTTLVPDPSAPELPASAADPVAIDPALDASVSPTPVGASSLRPVSSGHVAAAAVASAAKQLERAADATALNGAATLAVVPAMPAALPATLAATNVDKPVRKPRAKKATAETQAVIPLQAPETVIALEKPKPRKPRAVKPAADETKTSEPPTTDFKGDA